MLDPLIRLQAGDMQDLQVSHLYTEWDDPAFAESSSAGVASGYTEWSTPSRTPSLTFSWDWTYDRQSQRIEGHWRSLRTNLRVVGPGGEDLGDECTRLCAARLMTRAQWERCIADALGVELAMPVDSRH
jgi:hypothetical protein